MLKKIIKRLRNIISINIIYYREIYITTNVKYIN